MSKLMIVDDEAVITTQLEDRLQSMKYDVVGTASSAEESVSMARELCPDLILMDIVMKGKLDGIDAAKIIKADMDVPIIFLTAYADDKYIKRAMLAEPFGYIVKPFRENEIRANIEIALYKKELERKHKQAEERIRRLFLAIEHNPYKIMIIDTGGHIEFINNKFCQITNYTPREAVGKHIRFLKSDEMSSGVDEDLWGKITSGEECRGELCIKNKEGISDLKYTVALPVKNIKGDIIFFVVVMEETAKHKMRKELLLQSEKLNAMKTLTSGIAHEFNNIFAVISGNVQLLWDSFEGHGELKEELHTIKKKIDNGAEIIRNMLTFVESDRDTSGYVFCDLRRLIIQAIELIKSEDYDLVLCDLIMPEVSGYDVIKALNKLKKRPKTGIITGWNEKPKLIEDEGLTFDFVSKKPFDFLELTRQINDVFEGAQPGRARTKKGIDI